MRKFLKSNKRSKAVTGLIALVLTLSIILSTFTGLFAAAGNLEVWDGSTATGFASGTGTATDPYIIENGAQLRYLISLGADATAGKVYKLAADIYLNDTTAENWYTQSGLNEWPLLSSTDASVAFKGTFLGNGHIVYGIYAEETKAHSNNDARDVAEAAGLFPVLAGGASVDAVGVEKAYVKITNACSDAKANRSGIAGAIAGAYLGNSAANITITRCYAADTVKLTAAIAGFLGGNVTPAAGGVGNLNGSGVGVKITNCYNLLSWDVNTIESQDENARNGFIAFMGGSSVISGSFGLGNVAGTIATKGERNNYVTGWSSNAGTGVSIDVIYGGEAAKTGMPELDWDSAFMTTSGHPILKVFYRPVTGGGETGGATVWDGSVSASLSGSGTAGDPYLIKNGSDLAFMLKNGAAAGKYYALTNNIYLNDVAQVNWATGEGYGDYTPNYWFGEYDMNGSSYDVGETKNIVFKGHLNGNGFTVYGLCYRPGDHNSAAGLIPAANGASVKNLRIANSFISAGRWGGTVVGYATATTVSNVVVDESVTIHGYNAGAAYVTADIYNTKDQWPFWKAGGFQSTAISGVVGYGVTSVNISNVASYATIKKDGFSYVVSNPVLDGGTAVVANGGHVGGILGTSWNTNVNISNSLSFFNPYNGSNGTGPINVSNVYTTSAEISDKYTGVSQVNADSIIGATAKNALSGLNFDTVWATTEGYPTLQIFNAMDPSEYWNGTEVAPSKGTGTGADPILISTPEEFAYIIKNGMGGKHYKLEKDLYLNDITKIDWATGTAKTGYTPKSWYTSGTAAGLDGTFDGNGHKIYGLYSTTPGDKAWAQAGAGLFPKVAGEKSLTVSKLGVDYAYVRHPNGAAAFTAIIGGGGIVNYDQCFAGANVTLDGNNAGVFYAVGDKTWNLTNSYSLATLISAGAKGLIGDVYKYSDAAGPHKSTIANCYNANGPIYSKGQKVGTFANNYAIVTSGTENAAGETVLTAAEMQGLDVVTTGKMTGLGAMFQGTTTYPILTAFAPVKPAPETGVWDGSTKTAPSEGFGTEGNPFIIYNAAELAYVVTANNTAGKFYKLANDIFINEADKVNWATGEAIDDYKINSWLTSAGFAGTFDGNGHVVHGLYFKNTEAKEANNAGRGLFSHVTGTATIKNLGVDHAYVEYKHAAAAFVGNNTSTSITVTTIENSFVGENVTISGYASGAFVGVADRAFKLDHVYSLATLKKNTHIWKHYQTGIPEDRAGYVGLYGDFWGAGSTGSSVTNSYNGNGPIHSSGKVNLIKNAFYAAGGEADKTTAAIAVAPEKMQGLDVFNNEKPMQELNRDKAWEATNGYPVLDIFSASTGNDGEEPPEISDVDKNGVWNGLVLDTFSDNTSTGTQDDPIIITSPGELALVIECGGLGRYYKLANDIYLNDVTAGATWHSRDTNNGWYTNAAPTFSGHIDGAGHCVYGIWYPSTTTGAVGLIPKMQDGSVKNLGVRYSYIRSTQNLGAGAFIGYAANVITVEQCFSDETVTVSSTTAGGIVGLAQQNNGTSNKGLVMRNCYTKAKMANTSSVKSNGLVGDPWITAYEIYNSYSYGSKPYHVSGAGGKSAMYWYYKTKYDDTVKNWVTDITEPKDGKVATDYFKNIYTTTGNTNEDMIWTKISADDMTGLGAAAKMPGLDFENVWVAVEGGTPILKIFAGSITGENIDLSPDAEMFSKGKGTKADPYLIENVEQLRYLVQSETTAGKYYALANDIYVNDTSKKNWKTNAKTWYNNTNTTGFQGTLDGQGYTIYGLYSNQAPAELKNLKEGTDYIPQGTGLFPWASTNAEIRNLHIRNSYISGYGSTGAFVGELCGPADKNISIQGCSIDETVTVAGFTVGGFIGAGNNRTADIGYSYSTPELIFTGVGSRCNAFIGDTWGGLGNNIAQSYAQGYPISRNCKSADAVYCDVSGLGAKQVAAANMIGKKAKDAMPMLDWKNAFYTVNGDTPHLKKIPYGMSALGIDEGKKGRVWSGKSATKFAGGTGTKEDPYIIETPEQFVFMLNQDTTGKFYSITADLKLNNTSGSAWEQKARPWLSGSKYFRGHLNGNGHVVTGLYYETADSQNAGLIPLLGHSAVIEKLGIAKSTVINDQSASQHCYAGAMVGFLENYDGYMGGNADYEVRKIPEFHQCFIASDVSVIGESVGGFIGGGAAPVAFYNCYSVAHLEGTYRNGAFYGDIWEGSNEEKCYFENCYGATSDRASFGMGPNSGINATAINCYVDGKETNGAKPQNLIFMQGDAALKNMPELDYDKIWKIVKGGTPVLRCFPNAEKYSNKREPMKVKIEFVTGDGSPCEPLEGYPLVGKIDHDKLPVPELYGYKFEGWYFYDTLDLKFDLEYFPNSNIHIYAKFVMDGHVNGFEDKMYDDYDVTGGAYYHKPGVAGYNPKYINGGLRSMAADCTLEDADPMFFINYRYPLEVGNTYDVNFWMTTKTEGAEGTVEFVQGNYPDANDVMLGYNVAIEFTGLQVGEWKQYRVPVTANAPYLFVRTTGNAAVFYDDFQIVNLHKEGKLGELEGFNPSDISTEPGEKKADYTLFIILGIVGGVILLGAIATVTVVFIKKGKKAKVQ